MGVGGDVTVSAEATGGVEPYKYAWYLDGRARPGQTESSVHARLGEPGDHEVRVEVTDSADPPATANAAITLTVNTLEVHLGADHDEMASGGKSRVTAEVRGGAPPYTYAWELDGKAKPARADPSVTATLTTAGGHEVKVEVTDSGEPPVTGTASIVLKVYEALDLSLSADHTRIKEGGTVRASAKVTGGIKPYKYYWSVDGNAAPGEGSSLTATFRKPGEHSIGLRVTDASQSLKQEAKSAVLIEVEEAPLPPPEHFQRIVDAMPSGEPPGSDPPPPALPPDTGAVHVDEWGWWVMKIVEVAEDQQTGSQFAHVYYGSSNCNKKYCAEDFGRDVGVSKTGYCGHDIRILASGAVQCDPSEYFGPAPETDYDHSRDEACILRSGTTIVAGPFKNRTEADDSIRGMSCGFPE